MSSPHLWCVIFSSDGSPRFLVSAFLVAHCCTQGATLQVTLRCRLSVRLSVRGRTSAPPPTPKQLSFLEKTKIIDTHLKIFFHPKCFSSKIFFTQNFFSSKLFFSPPKKISHFHFFMHFWMFCAILSAQKIFHPKFFWVKQGTTQCYQAPLSDVKQVRFIRVKAERPHNVIT